MLTETNALTVYLGYTFLQSGVFPGYIFDLTKQLVYFSEARNSGQVITEPPGQWFPTWAVHLLKIPVGVP